MSGSSESATTSAGWPAATARAWSNDALYDCEKPTPFPAPVFWKAEMILPYASFGVEYATRSTDVPLEAPLAEPASTAIPNKAIQMLFIEFPYLLSFSRELVEIMYDRTAGQVGTRAL